MPTPTNIIEALAALRSQRDKARDIAEYRKALPSEPKCEDCTHATLRQWSVAQPCGRPRVQRSGICCDVLGHYVYSHNTCHNYGER
jgi:hypothetical protein